MGAHRTHFYQNSTCLQPQNACIISPDSIICPLLKAERRIDSKLSCSLLRDPTEWIRSFCFPTTMSGDPPQHKFETLQLHAGYVILHYTCCNDSWRGHTCLCQYLGKSQTLPPMPALCLSMLQLYAHFTASRRLS